MSDINIRVLRMIAKISVSLPFLAMLAMSSAYAAGTAAGTSVVNSVTVSYDLGGGSTQTASASVAFTVDRKIDLLVQTDDVAPVAVTSGQTNSNVGANAAATAAKFTVTNKSNATLDFELSAADDNNAVTLGSTPYADNTAAAIAYTYYYADSSGNFSASSVQVPTDTNGKPFIDNLAADDAKVIYAVAAVPAGVGNGSIINVSLKATAVEATNDGALIDQAGINKNDVANLGSVLTLYADAAGIVDGAKDAAYSAADVFVVSQIQTALVLSATVKDPWGGASVVQNAVITFTLTFTASGSGAFSNLVVQDNIPVGTTYQPNSITLDGAAVADSANYFNAGTSQCAVGGSTQPCINVGLSQSTTTLGTATPSVTHIVTFQAKVN